MGFALIHPQMYPSLGNQNNEARDTFKKQCELTANASLTIVFQDEVHYQVQISITAKWAPKGSKPKAMSKPDKQNVAYSVCLIPDTG